jgi:hypothetical protein
MNLDVSVLGFLRTAMYIIMFGFLWRYISARQSQTPVGKAMSFIY